LELEGHPLFFPHRSRRRRGIHDRLAVDHSESRDVQPRPVEMLVADSNPPRPSRPSVKAWRAWIENKKATKAAASQPRKPSWPLDGLDLIDCWCCRAEELGLQINPAGLVRPNLGVSVVSVNEFRSRLDKDAHFVL
jgi:hypothetical protein